MVGREFKLQEPHTRPDSQTADVHKNAHASSVNCGQELKADGKSKGVKLLNFMSLHKRSCRGNWHTAGLLRSDTHPPCLLSQKSYVVIANVQNKDKPKAVYATRP